MIYDRQDQDMDVIGHYTIRQELIADIIMIAQGTGNDRSKLITVQDLGDFLAL